MNQSSIMYTTARCLLPTNNTMDGSVKINPTTIIRWVMRISNVRGAVPDDVVKVEYRYSLETICTNGYPTKFVTSLYVASDLLLRITKNNLQHHPLKDVDKNEAMHRLRMRHSFCMQLLHDINNRFESTA